MRRAPQDTHGGISSAVHNTIAPERTLEDRKRLEAIGKPIKKYVDQRVAHTDEDALLEVPTYAELNAALDELGELLKKYISLFEATILGAIAPRPPGGLEGTIQSSLG